MLLKTAYLLLKSRLDHWKQILSEKVIYIIGKMTDRVGSAHQMSNKKVPNNNWV